MDTIAILQWILDSNIQIIKTPWSGSRYFETVDGELEITEFNSPAQIVEKYNAQFNTDEDLH